MVPRVGSPPLRKSPMVERDHSSIGSVETFFKESMRRDAMIGVDAACDL